MKQPYSIYIHIPFCRERCTYCAFNTYTDRDALMVDYVRALKQEICYLPEDLPVHTLYFGGGTPSLLPADDLVSIIDTARQQFAFTPDIEISIESNPGTVDAAFFAALVAAGVSRFSLGVQSAKQSELTLFGRMHDWDDVEDAVQAARAGGVTNLSLDLIYGVPNQSLEMWQSSVQSVLDLNPDHLSLYSLGLESGTEMTRQVKYGQLPHPNPDLVADMYEWATDVVEAQGFMQYEISNWGKAGTFCRHNIQYWRNEPYIGLGAGAHGYVQQTRTINAMRPEVYIERLHEPSDEALPFPQTPATIQTQPLDLETDQFETIFMGLRLLKHGFSLDAFAERYDERFEEKFHSQLAWLKSKDLIIERDHHLYLPRHARLISNSIFEKFMEAER